jgi:hypothetical protein
MADFEVYPDRFHRFRWRYVSGTAKRLAPLVSADGYATPHSALSNFNTGRFAAGGIEIKTANDWLRLLICESEHRRYRLNFLWKRKRRVGWVVTARNSLIVLASHTAFTTRVEADEDWCAARDTLCEPCRVIGVYGTDTRVMYEDDADIRVHTQGGD